MGVFRKVFMEEVVFALDLKERILKRRGGHFSNQEFHEITNLNKTKAHILEKEWGGIKWNTTEGFVYR